MVFEHNFNLNNAQNILKTNLKSGMQDVAGVKLDTENFLGIAGLLPDDPIYRKGHRRVVWGKLSSAIGKRTARFLIENGRGISSDDDAGFKKRFSSKHYFFFKQFFSSPQMSSTRPLLPFHQFL